MTDEDTKIEEALGKCADVHLPDDFANRLVERIRENGAGKVRKPIKGLFARIALVAASLTLLLGFVPSVMDTSSVRPAKAVAHLDEIRPAGRALPQDTQLNTLAFLGFCREAVRRRVRTLLLRSRKREDGE